MAFFITEAETERWLEQETRMLPMPDGSKRHFTDTKLTWRSVDFVTDKKLKWLVAHWGDCVNPITLEELIKKAIIWGKKDNLSFEITFPNMAVHLHREIRKATGID